MKYLTYSIIIIVFLLAGNDSSAKKVEKSKVKQVALNKYKREFKSSDDTSVKELMPYMVENDTLFYIVNIDDGFIMVSADDVTIPILGSSNNGNYNKDNMPPALEYLMRCYSEEIKYLKKNNIKATDQIKNQWKELETQTNLKSTLVTDIVSPLLDT